MSTMSGILVSLPASHTFIIPYHLLFISFSLQPCYSLKPRDPKTPFIDSPILTKGRHRTGAVPCNHCHQGKMLQWPRLTRWSQKHKLGRDAISMDEKDPNKAQIQQVVFFLISHTIILIKTQTQQSRIDNKHKHNHFIDLFFFPFGSTIKSDRVRSEISNQRPTDLQRSIGGPRLGHWWPK